MSTGLECEIVEVRPGEWYYILELGFAPRVAWDWREHARAVGPFPSYDAAWEHLADFEANPGGHAILALDGPYAVDVDNDETLRHLVDGAQPPQR